jgi:hypothetical protein
MRRFKIYHLQVVQQALYSNKYAYSTASTEPYMGTTAGNDWMCDMRGETIGSGTTRAS